MPFFLHFVLQLTLGAFFTAACSLVPIFRCPFTCPACKSVCTHWRSGYATLALLTALLGCFLSIKLYRPSREPDPRVSCVRTRPRARLQGETRVRLRAATASRPTCGSSPMT